MSVMVLGLKHTERVLIGPNIIVEMRKDGQRMRLIITAPKEVAVTREKVLLRHGMTCEDAIKNGSTYSQLITEVPLEGKPNVEE